MKEKTALIILNYNSWKLTIDFIENEVSKLILPEGTDIVVVDNCSTNDSAKKLKKWNESSHQCHLLFSDKNGGYAYGNNVGLKWAYLNGYTYGWVLNNDILFTDNEILLKMVDVLKQDPNIGVVSPRIFLPSGMETNRNLLRPSVYDLTLGRFRYRRIGRTVPDSLKGKTNSYCYNYRSQGCCMLTRLSIMNEVGYMDENTFMYMEEPILAERLLQKNYLEACCLSTKAIHNHSTTVRSEASMKKSYQWQHESEMYYYQHYRNFNKFSADLCCSFSWIKIFIVNKNKYMNGK